MFRHISTSYELLHEKQFLQFIVKISGSARGDLTKHKKVTAYKNEFFPLLDMAIHPLTPNQFQPVFSNNYKNSQQ